MDRLNGVAVALMFCCACSDGRAGAEAARCVDTTTFLLVDQASPAGFSASDVLEGVEGTWACELTWMDPGSVARASPEPGTTELSMSLRYTDGDVRYTDSVREGNPLERLGCLSSMEIELVLELVSSDGALAERLDVVARTDESRDGTQIEQAVMGFDGSYHYELVDEWPSSGTALAVSVDGDRASGFLVEWGATDPQTVEDPELGPIVEGSGVNAVVAEWLCGSR